MTDDLGRFLPNFHLPQMPDIKPIAQSLAEQQYASEFFERLVEWINEFNQGLDNDHEVGARLISFGQTVTIHLEDLDYWNPSLIKFIGRTADSGDPVELIQHVTQISVLLVTLKRASPEEPKRVIGFNRDGRMHAPMEEAEE